MAEFKKLHELLEDTLNNLEKKTLIALEYDEVTGEVIYKIIEDINSTNPTDIQQISWGLMRILEEDFETVLQKGEEVLLDKKMEKVKPFIKNNVIQFKRKH
jgi:hypothetical protein